ncbi:MAG TPA: flagellar hook assembly protein FlgD [Burkholderiales bacterium]|nr:flagellar hook assembly protein FlgD [Burkholderiales bacterium]
MATNPISSNAFLNSLTTSGQAQSQAQSTQAASLQDQFLKLLITQMQNQDPLNPLDNSQVTSQLAQISTVTGIDKLNTTITGMNTSMVASQSLQASALIGKGIVAPGDSLLLSNSQAVGGVQFQAPVDQAAITITNAAGQVVKTINLGAQQAGTQTFSWDGSTDTGGKAADGNYTFTVSALQGGQKVTTAATLGYGLVQSVTLGGDQLQLNTLGMGVVPMNKVQQIF